MNLAEASKIIGVAPNTVRSLARQGYIDFDRVKDWRQRWELLDSDVEKVAERYRINPSWRKSEHRKDEQLNIIERMASKGINPKQIALACGKTLKATRRHIERLQAAKKVPIWFPKWRAA